MPAATLHMDLNDKEKLVRKRQRRAIAASLSDFESLIEPHLPKTPEVREMVRRYKESHRKMLQDLATDAIDFMSLGEDDHVNGEAIHARDVLHLRPHEVRETETIGAAAA